MQRDFRRRVGTGAARARGKARGKRGFSPTGRHVARLEREISVTLRHVRKNKVTRSYRPLKVHHTRPMGASTAFEVRRRGCYTSASVTRCTTVRVNGELQSETRGRFPIGLHGHPRERASQVGTPPLPRLPYRAETRFTCGRCERYRLLRPRAFTAHPEDPTAGSSSARFARWISPRPRCLLLPQSHRGVFG